MKSPFFDSVAFKFLAGMVSVATITLDKSIGKRSQLLINDLIDMRSERSDCVLRNRRFRI